VGGDTRFDRVLALSQQNLSLPAIEAFIKNRQVVVAGSTWPADEVALAHCAAVMPQVVFIIVPHEVQASRLQLIDQLFKKSVRLSAFEKTNYLYDANVQEQPNILMVDRIGLLSSLYRLATVAYVGGGFGEEGVHNMLEAAVYGKPIVIGPIYQKYAEAVDLVAEKAAYNVNNKEQLQAKLALLLSDFALHKQAAAAAKNYVLQGQGATEKVLAYIKQNAF
jgi:3-deoxy-D-manno-octulosonic-acid transferase